MERFSFPCACICTCLCISHVWTGATQMQTQTQTQDEKYSFHAFTVWVQTKMASSTVTSDEKRAESVTKYLVLYDESCAGLREKLKQTTCMDWCGWRSGTRKRFVVQYENWTHLWLVYKHNKMVIFFYFFLFTHFSFPTAGLAWGNEDSGNKIAAILGYWNARAYLILLAFVFDVWSSL